MELGDRELIFEDAQESDDLNLSDLGDLSLSDLFIRKVKQIPDEFFRDKYNEGILSPIDDIVEARRSTRDEATRDEARRSTMIVELDFESQRFRIIKERYGLNPRKVLVYLNDEDIRNHQKYFEWDYVE